MVSPFPFLIFSLLCFSLHVVIALDEDAWGGLGLLVKKDQRRTLVSTEYGEVSAVEVSDEIRGPYHLEFITLEPNALFLPVILHADMVFYVHTGSGTLSWTQGEEMVRVRLQRGDVYRLQPGAAFFLQSNLDTKREKLRITATFASSSDDLHEPPIGAYSSINDLIQGFDKKVLQAAFKAPEEVIEAITNATSPAIVRSVQKRRPTLWEWEVRFINAFLGTKGNSMADVENRRKKSRAFNILNADPDFENCNGWSLTVTKKDFLALKGSNIGVFMVNLTKGSMMGPHWNPMATEIAMVIQGRGMVREVCASNAKESKCKNMRFRVTEGDVFAVPRFHPMAQMSFNNDSLVFVGFSTTTKKNYPQFLAGKASVLQALDKEILAASFNVDNTTIDRLLASQADSIILDCTSCAEEEERIMEEEIERERQEEEARKREEEEARRREEEEARKREEEEKRREEEEARKRAEEEKRREEEEARRRREEEARRREKEEAKKRREEEEAEKREEEEERRQQEEEKRGEEEAKRREEEERRQQEEEKRRREEEVEKRREEEEARKREEEEEARRRREEEARRREEEEAEKRREEEEAEKREEEERRQQEEEKRRREEEEEREKREREPRQQEEEEVEREQEEARRQEEERQQQAQEEERRWKKQEKRRQEEAEREQGEARRQEEEKETRERQQEEETRKERERQERARRQRGEETEEAAAKRKEQEREGGGEGRRVMKFRGFRYLIPGYAPFIPLPIEP